ncbi:Serine/threonine-protein kinase NLK [Triplophysa tibetana]|uniref:Serine/threonine-protein kinase NLK n=1 Tax=Triplophysa tibetana TaxID=1572043 RepID=A0A5A9MXI2_9TELE|nr:Serine/threonine-protein kinase NLK [Triplophysa tibetana]
MINGLFVMLGRDGPDHTAAESGGGLCYLEGIGLCAGWGKLQFAPVAECYWARRAVGGHVDVASQEAGAFSDITVNFAPHASLLLYLLPHAFTYSSMTLNTFYRVTHQQRLTSVPCSKNLTRENKQLPVGFFNQLFGESARGLGVGGKKPSLPVLYTLSSQATHEAVHLLCRMLVFDPSKRISAKDALAHPYLDEGRLRYHTCMCKCCYTTSSGRVYTNDFEPVTNPKFDDSFEKNLSSVRQVKEIIHQFIMEQQKGNRVPLCINPQSAAFKSFISSSTIRDASISSSLGVAEDVGDNSSGGHPSRGAGPLLPLTHPGLLTPGHPQTA